MPGFADKSFHLLIGAPSPTVDLGCHLTVQALCGRAVCTTKDSIASKLAYLQWQKLAKPPHSAGIGGAGAVGAKIASVNPTSGGRWRG
ncbi:MAG TPA: hypothetical protein VL048_05510 [Xanthobacteraceae bacterium]|nr:hypothetical protein [Xanthobacteraceae bacterium]